MKQETLEEVAKRLYPHKPFWIGSGKSARLYDEFKTQRDSFIEGAKWQQERSYSEEDLKEAFLDGWQLRDGDLPFSKAKNKWFKTVKKKS